MNERNPRQIPTEQEDETSAAGFTRDGSRSAIERLVKASIELLANGRESTSETKFPTQQARRAFVLSAPPFTAEGGPASSSAFGVFQGRPARGEGRLVSLIGVPIRQSARPILSHCLQKPGGCVLSEQGPTLLDKFRTPLQQNDWLSFAWLTIQRRGESQLLARGNASCSDAPGERV
jgi:hypothetical protein